jgi:sugar phosphate isomerase/epimerase
MAGVFPGNFELWKGNTFENKYNFVAARGFNGSHISFDVLAHAEKRKFIEDLQEHQQQAQFVGFHPQLREEVNTVQTDLSVKADKLLEARKEGLDLPVAVVVIPGGLNRFTRDFPLAKQLQFLVQVLTPMVDCLKSAGVEVAIENHGDYYISDLVELCGNVPGLSIMLDTGNCFLIGERPDLIPDEAYPLISCTHFKDHWVSPNQSDITFNCTGATLGEGHVELEALYQKMLKLHPDPASIRLMIEWVPDPEKSAIQCFNQSLKFLERISGGNFVSTPAPEVK